MIYYIEKDGKTVTTTYTPSHHPGDTSRMFAVDPETNTRLRKDADGVWEYNRSPDAAYGREDWVSMKA